MVIYTSRPCPELAQIAGVTIRQSAELLPSSIATYTCADTGEPPADGNAVRMCQRNGTWTGNSPTICDPCFGVDCSDHGTCSDGVCTCTNGWSGTVCDMPCCSLPETQWLRGGSYAIGSCCGCRAGGCGCCAGGVCTYCGGPTFAYCDASHSGWDVDNCDRTC